MEIIQGKPITQEDLQKASSELLEIEIKKSDPKLTAKDIEKLEQREQELYKMYPMLLG